MKLPNTTHTSRPWRIHELTRDFRLEDVWALPTPGGPDDFPPPTSAPPAKGEAFVTGGRRGRSWREAARPREARMTVPTPRPESERHDQIETPVHPLKRSRSHV
jgi:hypothetical protein